MSARPMFSIVVAVPLLVISSVADASPVNYFNQIYRFGLRLPMEYLNEDKTERSETGTILRSSDGKAVATIFGVENAAGKSIGSLVAEYKRKTPQAKFTYEWRHRNAAVLSGYEEGDIFYIRIALSDDGERAAILSMTYAREVKRRLDPLVAQLSRSLFIE